MSSIRQQLRHVLFIDIKEIRAIVEENTKELKSQLEVHQTISKKMTMQISSVEKLNEGICSCSQ